MAKREATPLAPAGPSGADSEIELKLLCDAGQLERVGAMPAITRHAVGAERLDALSATYYDTEALDLRQLGISLRVRAEGSHFIMTAKTAGNGNLLQRGEKKVPVAGMEPDPVVLGEILDAEVLARISQQPLLPVFTTEVQRRVRVLQHPLATVELAMDHGRISTGERHEDVCEVELELLDGRPLALWQLAHDMLEDGAFRPSLLTKSDRGFALFLARQQPPPVMKDSLPAFGGTFAQGIRPALAWHVRRLILLQPAAAQGLDPEGVHQYRIALRRLLTLLRVVRTVAPTPDIASLMAQAKTLLRQLSPARAWDVFLHETLPEAARARDAPGAFDALRTAAQHRRLDAQAEARAALEHVSTARFLIQAGLWTESESWRDHLLPAFRALASEPLAAFAGDLLERQYKRVTRRGRGFGQLDAAARHRVRLAAKTLRYALEFLGQELDHKHRSRRFLHRLSRLQNHLGHMSDAGSTKALLVGIMKRGPDADVAQAVGFIEGMQAARQARMDRRLVRSWKRFRAAKSPWAP